MLFKKGQSGNPSGKPKGCKNKVTRKEITQVLKQYDLVARAYKLTEQYLSLLENSEKEAEKKRLGLPFNKSLILPAYQMVAISKALSKVMLIVAPSPKTKKKVLDKLKT